jgi:ubiquinone/menaquinone biosynthesis C-methylase UbiE
MSHRSARNYLMEHQREGVRLREKSDDDATRSQLLRVGLTSGMAALDVGCGSGSVTVEMARIVAPGTAVGTDTSTCRLEEARTLARQSGAANIEFHQGDAYCLPFSDNTFDFVWSRFLLEYLREPLTAIREMKRVTKLGGLVVCADLDGNCLFHYPIDPHLENSLRKIMAVLADRGFDPWVGRKLYHYCHAVGFSQIDAFMVPHHLIAGAPCERERLNWQRKIDILRDNLLPVFPDAQEFDHLGEQFMELIDSSETFTYSPLILIVGKK